MAEAREHTRHRRGRPPHRDVLTPAEWSIVHAIRHGLSNRTIARRKGVSLDAVKFHVANIRAKLGVATRGAVRRWRGVPATSAIHLTKEATSVGSLGIGSIGQIARAVDDVSRAEAWYRDVLGLPHLYTFGQLAFFDCGGTRLMIEARSIVNEPGLRNDSILYFRVPDIHQAYDELCRRQVEFIGAPHMIHRHADGTEEWMAFFKDSEGGLLALMSQARSG